MKQRNKPAGGFRAIALDGKQYNYTLIKRHGQKHIHIRVNSEGRISVSAPPHVTGARIEEVLRKKAGWLDRQLMRIEQNAAERDIFRSGLLYRGKHYRIICDAGEKMRSFRVDESEHTIRIETDSCEREHVLKILKNWLRGQAKKTCREKVPMWSKKLKIPYESISIRDQKTRWGSSSGKGHISLNWRIILIPEIVQDYLIIHELLHQLHHNHSATFWDAVSKVFPKGRTCDRWLKDHDILMSVLR